MELATGLFIGICGSLIAGLLVSPVRIGMGEAWHVLRSRLDPDGINLTGQWIGTFDEPRDKNGERFQSSETVKIRQVGRRVTGLAMIGDPFPRTFAYVGTLNHHILSLTYRRIDAEKGSVSGSGVLYAKVSDDRREVIGICVWVDKDTKRLELSKYKLTKCDEFGNSPIQKLSHESDNHTSF